ncbi:MAG: hypothetical protein ICV69_03865 [Thermoleophilaceae bacterium]|nr:hypothetical protein [Thermoleophilaceae bacterium]
MRQRRLVLGHTLDSGAEIRRVTLYGRRVSYRIRPTNRGLGVLVAARRPGRAHELVVWAGYPPAPRAGAT